MLGKLIKHEIRATYKLKCLMFGLIGVLSVIFALIIEFVINTFGDLGIVIGSAASGGYLFLYINGIFAMFTVIGITSVIRFKTGLMGSQGYLIHTLPVKTGDKIKAKLFTAVMWTALALVVVLVTDLVIRRSTEDLVHGFGVMIWDEIFDVMAWDNILSGIDIREWVWVFARPVLMLVLISFVYMHIFFCVTFGYSFEKHKLLSATSVFLLTTFAMAVLLIVLDEYVINPLEKIVYPQLILSVYFAILGILYYMLTKYFMENELNLE